MIFLFLFDTQYGGKGLSSLCSVQLSVQANKLDVQDELRDFSYYY